MIVGLLLIVIVSIALLLSNSMSVETMRFEAEMERILSASEAMLRLLIEANLALQEDLALTRAAVSSAIRASGTTGATRRCTARPAAGIVDHRGMCGRVFVRTRIEGILHAFAFARAERMGNSYPTYNGCPGNDYLIVVREPDRIGPVFIRAIWGFVPSWANERNPGGRRAPIFSLSIRMTNV